MHTKKHLILSLIIAAGCALFACDSDDSTNNGESNNGETNNGTTAGSTSNSTTGATKTGEGLNPAYILADGLESDITEVDCTLSDGSETTCYRIEIKGAPADHAVGPFCPRTTSDTAEDVGIWIENDQVYDLTGQFITELATFYNDDKWALFNGTDVNVTETQEACEAAARPDVDPQYNNFCVECSLDYVDGGIVQEFLIPKTPKAAATPSEIGGMNSVGIALNGGFFDPPAPTDAILAAYTIAAFDDCGGHINTNAGYHYHAATGCTKEVAQEDNHAPLIGYALDGYAMHAMVGDDGIEETDLDNCRGHEDAVRGYHYHVASAGENMFIGCFNGLIVGDADTGGGGGDTAACEDGQTSMCCGDGVCDGPETAADCPADCA